ncbi:MAG: hypothetical protein U1F30_10450 [Steroidobacteraceae bacterium]
MRSKPTNSPLNEATSFDQMACIAWTCSRTGPTARGIDAVVDHLLDIPSAPTPTSIRPAESTSSVAIVLARRMGSRWATSVMLVPKRSRSVTLAVAPMTAKGSRLCQ